MSSASPRASLIIPAAAVVASPESLLQQKVPREKVCWENVLRENVVTKNVPKKNVLRENVVKEKVTPFAGTLKTGSHEKVTPSSANPGESLSRFPVKVCWEKA